MAKTKFFRVAVEGKTVDGREITRDMIQQMADTYNPATYTARINCEHLRGYSPEPPFNSWGSVTALKADTVELSLGGKTEKRMALFAQLDVNDQAKSYNEADQKIFPSVEAQPNFAGTNKAYMVGFAVTDSPASIGTEVMKFSRDDKRKDNLLYLSDEPISLSFEDSSPAADIAGGVMEGITKFFASFGKAAPEPVIQTPAPAAGDNAALDARFNLLMTQIGEQFTAFGDGIQKSFTAQETRIAKMSEDFTALQAKIEKTPATGFTSRPQASGGDGRARAEC